MMLKLIPENSKLYHKLALLGISLTARQRLKKRSILTISIHLTDHCNLNCVGCAHFSNISEEYYLDIESFKRDIERLAVLTGSCMDFLYLSGGECLLHPNLIDFFGIARQYFPATKIILQTNGILLVSQKPDFWQACRDNNIVVGINRYPIKLNKEKIIALSKQYHVEVIAFSSIEVPIDKEVSIPTKSFMCKFPLDLNGSNDYIKSAKFCTFINMCIMLVHGKLYTCPVTAYIYAFNKYFHQNLIVSPDDYIDIYKTENIDDIFEFLCKPKPFCRYCTTKNIQTDIPWSVSKKELSEYV